MSWVCGGGELGVWWGVSWVMGLGESVGCGVGVSWVMGLGESVGFVVGVSWVCGWGELGRVLGGGELGVGWDESESINIDMDWLCPSIGWNGYDLSIRYLLQFCHQCKDTPLPSGMMEDKDAKFVDINGRNAVGATPLELAASQGHREVVR